MHTRFSGLLFITGGLLLLVHATDSPCMAQRRQSSGNSPAAATERTYSTVRQVDFNNFVYRIGGQQITLRKGTETARYPKGEGGCTYLVQTISYGDLTSDEKEEAVVVLGCTMAPEGNGYSNAGYIYTLRQGQPVLLTDFEGGGRGDSIIGTLVAPDGTLIVVKDDMYNDRPRFLAITYRWNRGKLIEGGKSAIKIP